MKTLAKLNHPNIVQYKAAWIEPSLPSSFVSNVPSTSTTDTSTSHRSYTSENTKDSKSNILQFNENSSNNTSNSNFNKTEGSSRQDTFLDNKTSYAFNIPTKLSIRQKNKICVGADGRIVRSDIVNERFHELNSLTNIMEDPITEKSNKQESSGESSHVVSFRNSNSSENEDQAIKCSNFADYSDSHLQKSSNHQEVCTVFSTSTSNGVSIANVYLKN